MKFLRAAALSLLISLCSCAPQKMFYQPNRRLYADPLAMGIHHETVSYPSLNGKKLWALWMPADGKPRGTVVHFHGNFANISNHFPLSVFLTKAGFDVLIFDYQGFGASEGRPTARNTVEDGIASVRFAHNRSRNPDAGVGIFGQSLGGAVGIVVAAEEPLVKAAVIESAFASYTGMAKTAMRRHWLTWPFSFLSPLLFNRSQAPIKHVTRIAPRPVFFIHGDKDRIVPVRMSRQLYEQAREPKRLWIVEGAGHLEPHRVAKTYQEEIIRFFREELKETRTD